MLRVSVVLKQKVKTEVPVAESSSKSEPGRETRTVMKHVNFHRKEIDTFYRHHHSHHI